MAPHASGLIEPLGGPFAASQRDGDLEFAAVSDDGQIDRVARVLALDGRQEIISVLDRPAIDGDDQVGR